MPAYARHTLLDITRRGRERIVAELAGRGYDEAACAAMLLPADGPAAPGIVRREELAPRAGRIPVGFSFWRADEERGRLRIPSFVRPEEIERVSLPEDAARALLDMDPRARRRTPALRAAEAVLSRAAALPADLGLWGTAALEAHTGRLYTHAGSDLDLLLSPRPPADGADLRRCLDAVLAAEKKFSIRIDPEVLLPSGYGISLKEFLNEGATVLGKGPRDAVLIQKEDVLVGLASGRTEPRIAQPLTFARSNHGTQSKNARQSG